MSHTSGGWIDENTQGLSVYLQSYLENPEGGPLTEESLLAVARLIHATVECGTNHQKRMLYFLLINTRSQLRENGDNEMYQPLSQLTQLFKHLCQEEATQLEDELLNENSNVSVKTSCFKAA